MHPRAVYTPTHPWLGALGGRLSHLAVRALCATQRFYDAGSAYARERTAALQDRLRQGAPVYLLGIGPGGHNSGVALIEVTSERGVRLLHNNEEERFAGIKHCTDYPDHSIEALLEAMAALDIRPGQLFACLASWDYIKLSASLIRAILQEVPQTLTFLDPASFPALNIRHIVRACMAPERLGRQMGLSGRFPF